MMNKELGLVGIGGFIGWTSAYKYLNREDK